MSLTFYPPQKPDELNARQKAKSLYEKWILPTALEDDRNAL